MACPPPAPAATKADRWTGSSEWLRAKGENSLTRWATTSYKWGEITISMVKSPAVTHLFSAMQKGAPKLTPFISRSARIGPPCTKLSSVLVEFLTATWEPFTGLWFIGLRAHQWELACGSWLLLWTWPQIHPTETCPPQKKGLFLIGNTPLIFSGHVGFPGRTPTENERLEHPKN